MNFSQQGPVRRGGVGNAPLQLPDLLVAPGGVGGVVVEPTALGGAPGGRSHEAQCLQLPRVSQRMIDPPLEANVGAGQVPDEGQGLEANWGN